MQLETFAAAAAVFPVFAVSAVLSGALHLYGHCVCFIVVFRHGATVTKLYFPFLFLSAQHTHNIYQVIHIIMIIQSMAGYDLKIILRLIMENSINGREGSRPFYKCVGIVFLF